jgi:integrase
MFTSAPGRTSPAPARGRKQRITPLTAGTVAVLRTWTTERGGQPSQPLFPARTGSRPSRDALEHRLAKHTTIAAASCPSLNGKTINAHTLRHTAVISPSPAARGTAKFRVDHVVPHKYAPFLSHVRQSQDQGLSPRCDFFPHVPHALKRPYQAFKSQGR